VDWDGDRPDERDTVYLLEGKRFDDAVSTEFGNFAYLLGCDLDFQDPEVREEVTRWGRWMLDTTGVDGFRLDAIKHISSWFFPEWLDAMERHARRDLFVVGEYWTDHRPTLQRYLDAVGGRMAVFDVPLHYRFHQAGRAGAAFDLRSVLEGSLVQARPTQAVTFVDNHDSQPLQALESPVEAWFKPLAYALILLRREGYPCVFWADYLGADYEDLGHDGQRHRVTLPSHRFLLDRFLAARRDCAHGEQRDWFDHPNVIGWTRLGDAAHPRALAVLMSNGADGWKWMEVARRNATFHDITGHCCEPVRSNEDGWACFRCRGGSVSVWLEQPR
jgi:alpha-amylase